MFQINTNFIPPSPKTYIVGGTVRDIILGRPPGDYDIVTLENPESLAGHIQKKLNGRIIELGKPGMKIFRIVAKNQTIDIAPAIGNSIEEDLKKRDFTINAMAISIDGDSVTGNGKLIDIHNGMDDLNNGIIRMVSRENLLADPLRMLRAYRIGAMLKFSIDSDTCLAIKTESTRIRTSAGERIKDELFKLFNSPLSYYYLSMMNDSGLLAGIFPELIPLKECAQNTYHQYNAFEHTMNAYNFLEIILHSQDVPFPDMKKLKPFLPPFQHFAGLKYSILLHDIGKPCVRSVDEKGLIHFYAHEQISADMTRNISRRLRLSNQEQHYSDFIIRHHIKPLSLFTAYSHQRLSQKALNRFFLKCGPMTKDLLIHTAADIYGKGVMQNRDEFIEFIRHILDLYTDSFLPRSSEPPLINGEDLINEFGLRPSPQFAEILRQVEEERISANIRTRCEALDLVKKILNRE